MEEADLDVPKNWIHCRPVFCRGACKTQVPASGVGYFCDVGNIDPIRVMKAEGVCECPIK